MAAILDHLWQSSLFTAGMGLLALLLRRNEARIRYWLWFAASVKFLLPFSVLASLGRALAPDTAPMASLPVSLYLVEHTARPFNQYAVPDLLQPEPASFDPLMLLWVAWALGAAMVLGYWLFSWMGIQKALKQAVPLAVAAPLPVKVTTSSLGPGLFGFWRPVLLMPKGVVEHLTPAEQGAVIAHELCHMQRRDNLTGAIHMLVEAAFWFYPLVWWLGARMNVERERACDEGVIGSGNDVGVYADSIIKVCRFYDQSPLPCVSGVSGAALVGRIETIMNPNAIGDLRGWQKLVLAGAFCTALAWPVATGWISTVQDEGLWAGVPSVAEVAKAAAGELRPHKAIAIQPETFDRFAGYYEFTPNFVMQIKRQGTHYFVGMPANPLREIFPEGSTEFFMKVIPLQITFLPANNEMPASAVWRIHGAQKRVYQITPQRARAIEQNRGWRIKHNIPNPGTEKALRYYISQVEQGRLPSEIMAPWLLVAVRPWLPQGMDIVERWGPLRALRFRSEDRLGDDLYDATFANAKVEWMIEPLEGGKLNGMHWREIFSRKNSHTPSPGTEAVLRDFISDLALGRPNYARIESPLSIRQIREQQLPAIKNSLSRWGPLESLSFISTSDEGMDIYEAKFANGRSEWQISPLTANGKIQRIYFPNTDHRFGG